ncbi:MAG: hypothetical protein A2887_05700 [Alphaproteobacteria bacterium RIFCSPLOWO2_01_FULL_40_26]|nr:MAG: hypothetical protein A2887_05700 [Alphaproteobacteria bacterium RIFCSPLOWO2_01_FULL_40_26]OFX09792.1 MAG: hypothetical protein A3H30_00460 [Alphaproteobacteria bacterium RIFCSPLOWO2_02_FULL_40_19]OFX12267.1 MAG: hypothetical protein A3G22_06970 [Alphaproteobacteria bacterium RIFCSPLOWO2_12_FULL_40_11]
MKKGHVANQLSRACFQTHHISLLPKFWLVFWQNFLQYARYSGKILPKSRTKFGQNRNALGLKTGSKKSEPLIYKDSSNLKMVRNRNLRQSGKGFCFILLSLFLLNSCGRKGALEYPGERKQPKFENVIDES